MSLTIRTQKSEFTFYDYRSFFIETPLLGSSYARAERKREGIYWLDLWWGDDEKTVYNFSIGKWCITHDLPRWLCPKRYAKKAANRAEKRQTKSSIFSDLIKLGD